MKKFLQKYFKYLLLAALIYMPIFGHLGTLPIRIYDESRLAVNAYEMSKDGDFIVTHFEGRPDMWNTKPPLLIWLQVFFTKILGVNEISVRLPSAIAAFLTCLLILIFSVRYLKQFWFGFIAVIVLITSHGYINVHVSRTGDYDALLTLFTTLSGLLFFAFIETKKNKFLYLFFLSTALAVLTKSIAGLLFMPALFIFALWQKQLLNMLKNKHFYFGLASFLLLTLGYYLLREYKNPGYISAVLLNELGGRYLIVNETHKAGIWFYYTNFIALQLSVWYLLIPCGIIVGLVEKNDKIRRLTQFSTLMALTYLIIISFSQTKLEWYDAPMYPFIALLIATFIYYVFTLLKNSDWINNTLKYTITPFIFLFLVLIPPYQKIVDKTYLPQEYPWDKEFYEISYYLKDAIKDKQKVDKYYLLYDGYYAHNYFYLKILQDKGVKISFKDWKNLDQGDHVIACQKNVKDYLTENYAIDIIEEKGNVIKYKIHERKH